MDGQQSMTEQLQPLVTIAIPTFQAETHIAQALNSALSQTYKNIEIVISDNGSTDRTLEIVRKITANNSRIRVFSHPTNQGPTFNFTFAFKEARGDFFFWLGDDDWIDSNYVEVCVSNLIKDKTLSACVGLPTYYIDEKFFQTGRIIKILSDSPLARVFRYLYQAEDNGIFYGGIRRSHLSEVPFENIMGWDWLMFSSLTYRGKLLTDPSVSLHRRLGRISSSYARIAATMELPKWNARFPYLAITLNINRALWTIPKAFPKQNFFGRLVYSTVITAAILLKYLRSRYWMVKKAIKPS
jgi:glycosyltransferase involved in cell wall biosynthesis